MGVGVLGGGGLLLGEGVGFDAALLHVGVLDDDVRLAHCVEQTLDE